VPKQSLLVSHRPKTGKCHFGEVYEKFIYIYIYIRLKIKPNSVRIRF
jgi:hypothetical protein